MLEQGSIIAGARRLGCVVGIGVLGACATTAPRAPVASTAFADADSVHVSDVAHGVTHSVILDRRGPWAIHVVEVDTTRCVPVLQARKPGRELAARATTSELATAALVTINADFFMLPGGTPVGAHVSGGTPLIGPTDRQVFAVTQRGWRIGAATLAGWLAAGRDTARLSQINRPATPFSAYAGTRTGVTLFTSWIGDSVPGDSAARRVTLRLLEGDEHAGRAVVVTSDSTSGATRMLPRSAVLLARADARAWARRRAAGDTVVWYARVLVGDTAGEAVGGFPELLRAGRDVLADQTVREDFGSRRHPRTAIGWTRDGRLLLVVVDGRQPPYSDGMSLPELTWLFRRLGASDALNLDGGGSTALVVRGMLVNRPSDREGERAIGNALALARCG